MPQLPPTMPGIQNPVERPVRHMAERQRLCRLDQRPFRTGRRTSPGPGWPLPGRQVRPCPALREEGPAPTRQRQTPTRAPGSLTQTDLPRLAVGGGRRPVPGEQPLDDGAERGYPRDTPVRSHVWTTCPPALRMSPAFTTRPKARTAADDLEAEAAHINPSVPAQSTRASTDCAHRTAGRVRAEIAARHRRAVIRISHRTQLRPAAATAGRSFPAGRPYCRAAPAA